MVPPKVTPMELACCGSTMHVMCALVLPGEIVSLVSDENDDNDDRNEGGGGATGCSSDLCVRGSNLDTGGEEESADVVVIVMVAPVSLASLLRAASAKTFL